jgi:hypothetical protein
MLHSNGVFLFVKVMMEKMLQKKKAFLVKSEKKAAHIRKMVQHYFGEGTMSTPKCVGEGLVIS